jgi:hypothetical protein
MKHPGAVDQTAPGCSGEKRGRKMKRTENAMLLIYLYDTMEVLMK